MDEQDREKTGAEVKAGGSCCSDPFAGIPPELRPNIVRGSDGLRQVTCPHCGLVYSTNRKTDVCVRCEGHTDSR